MSDGTRTRRSKRHRKAAARYGPGVVVLPDVRGRAGTLVASEGMPPWVAIEFRNIVRAMRANRAELNALAASGVVAMVPEGTRVRVRSQMGHGTGVEIPDGEHKGRKAWTMTWHIRLDGENAG